MNATTNAGVFVKRPLAVDAWRFTNDGDSYNLLNWINHAQREAGRPFARWVNDNLIIRTLEGDMAASTGDWIIRGTKGEFYPCKPDIFADIYDRIGDLAPASGIETEGQDAQRLGAEHESATAESGDAPTNPISPSITRR